MKLKIALFLLSTAAFGVSAQHEGHAGPPVAERPAAWTDQPLLVPAPGGRGERSAAVLQAAGIDAPQIEVFGPGGEIKVFPVSAGKARIETAAPGIGNYHRVMARQEEGDQVRVASSVWYFGNPGPSPVALLQQATSELEIVPDPLPREHGSYRESEKWRFIVRFRGQPLAGQTLRLDTAAGTRSSFVSDGQGVVTVLFPRDLDAVVGKASGGHERTQSGFVLSTESAQEGKHFVTAFNYTYGPDADRGRSLAWGSAFGLAGMISALPLLRRRRAAQPGKAEDASC